MMNSTQMRENNMKIWWTNIKEDLVASQTNNKKKEKWF